MKKLSIIFTLSLIIFVSLTLSNAPTQAVTKDKLTSFNYTITYANNNEYYGSHNDGTGIHFTSDNTNYPFKVGDNITAYFHSDNTIDGLVSVQPAKYITFDYTITSIKGNDYYGKHSDGTGIYFTSDYTTDKLNVNDKVVAYFTPDNIEDGLVKVKKVE